MCSLDATTKARFAAARYMDDILLIYDKRAIWNSVRFLTDFGASECYQPPLKLEPGNDGIFLENELYVGTCGIRYKLKNVNAYGERKVWRYHHFSSYTPYSQKRATLVATLKKVDKMGSDSHMRVASAYAKLAEFSQLGYPTRMLQYACQRVGRETGHSTWFKIAKGNEDPKIGAE